MATVTILYFLNKSMYVQIKSPLQRSGNNSAPNLLQLHEKIISFMISFFAQLGHFFLNIKIEKSIHNLQFFSKFRKRLSLLYCYPFSVNTSVLKPCQQHKGVFTVHNCAVLVHPKCMLVCYSYSLYLWIPCLSLCLNPWNREFMTHGL